MSINRLAVQAGYEVPSVIGERLNKSFDCPKMLALVISKLVKNNPEFTVLIFLECLNKTIPYISPKALKIFL